MGGLEISRRQDTTFDNPITTSKWVRDSRSIKSALAPHRIGSWTNSPVPTLLVIPRSSQAQRLHASDRLHPQPPKVCPQRPRDQGNRHATLDQGGGKGPNRRDLPSWFHG